MSKVDTLLKKATVFERLAVYGDRKTFLQSLAQAGDPLVAAVRALSDAIDKWVNSYGVRRSVAGGLPGVPESMQRFVADIKTAAASNVEYFTNDRVAEISKSAAGLGAVNVYLKDADDNVRHSWLSIISPLADRVRTIAAQQLRDRAEWAQSIPPGGESAAGGEERYYELDEGAPAAKKPKYPPIPRDVQEMLGKIVVTEAIGNPVRIDGSLGPDTRTALNAFRRKFNVPGNFSDADVFTVIKNTYNRDPARYNAP